MKIPFQNLKTENALVKNKCLKEINDFVDNSNFILSKEVEIFEKNFSNFCQAKYGLAVSSGTAALHLTLSACGIKGGDEVITTPISFTATSLAIAYCNAKPVFVDVLNDGNIDPSKIEKAITLKTKAILIVHLYGNPGDLLKIKKIAKKYKLFLIDDCAHAHGAKYRGKKIGSLTDISCWSFYPTKNLGAWGDAGSITTNNKVLYEKSKLLRVYGEVKKNDSRLIGFNNRPQSIQAIVLNEKLKYLNLWNKKRINLARIYTRQLAKVGDIQTLPFSVDSSYYVFPIKTKKRDALKEFLTKNGINAQIHYPKPIHFQTCFNYLGYKKGDLPRAEEHAKTVLSLPLYISMSLKEQDYVIKMVKEFFKLKK